MVSHGQIIMHAHQEIGCQAITIESIDYYCEEGSREDGMGISRIRN